MKPAPYSKPSTDRIDVRPTRGPTSKYIPVGDNPKFDVDRKAGRVRYHSNRRPVTDPAIIAALAPTPGVFVALECCVALARIDHLAHGLSHRARHIDRLIRERPLGYRLPRPVPKRDCKPTGWPDTVGRDRTLMRHARDNSNQFARGEEFIPLLGRNLSREEQRWGR